MSRLSREAIIERLRAIAPASLRTLEEATQGEKAVECPGCHEEFKVKIPDSLAVKAALDTLKLIPGIGSTTRVESSRTPKGNEWDELVRELAAYSLPDRLNLVRQVLPEYWSALEGIVSSEISTDGASPGGAIN